MLTTAIIAVITFLLLTLSILFFPSVKIGKIKLDTYWCVALLGALVLLFTGLTPASHIWNELNSHTAINPIKILVLFFSMTFLSVFLDEVGFFRYLAKTAARSAGKNQIKLFIILYILTSVLTVFTSNDIIILTLTPFICFFCKHTNVDPVPYLVGEFAAANTWSMMLMIGNPTNIYLATSAGIGFTEYLKVMLLPTLAAGLVEFLLIILLFYKKLKKELQPEEDDFCIKSRPELVTGLLHLFVCLVFLVVSSYIHVEMWLVSAVCAASLLLFALIFCFISKDNTKYITHSLKRLPWQLIPFVLSMFVIVICLNYQGISERLGDLLGDRGAVWTYGFSSFLSANIINNIPMSILYSTLPSGLLQADYYRAIYASIVGSNIGAFLTPIGALAGIMFTGLTERYKVNYGFRKFIEYGAVISIPTISAALGVLYIVLS